MSRASRRACLAFLALLVASGCRAPDDLPVLSVDAPLHLEDHLADARVTGSVAPADAPQAVEWRFDGAETPWRVAPSWSPTIGSPSIEHTGEALRVTLADSTRWNSLANGGIYVDVPGWQRDDWSDVVVRLRSDSTVGRVMVRANLREGRGVAGDYPSPFQAGAQEARIVRDGTVQTYRLEWPRGPAGAEVRELGLWFTAPEGPGSVDILSVRVPPVEEGYQDPPLGLRHILDPGLSHRTLYTNVPSRLEFQVVVPDGGRLDYGMRALRDSVPVTFRVAVQPARGEAEILSDDVVSDKRWLQRSVDLSAFVDETVTLVLKNSSPDPGAIALWSAPTVSGGARPSRPNVIFYVIDTAAADQMSLYGYNRRTTPNLEAIAGEGVVFERAHSNAANTITSTPSFMTSLHSGVLGRDRVFSPKAKTMAQWFHEARYQTAVFTWNPNAGAGYGLERGVDVYHAGTNETYNSPSRSSVALHRDFWDWRAAYPGTPYWAHFQTLDVHRPTVPPPPFAGLFAPVGTAERLAREDSILRAWNLATEVHSRNPPALWDDTGLDRVAYYDARRALYDETMAHQDYEFGRFVERLKASGEWDNTLLIVASDHSIQATDDFLTFGGAPETADEPYLVLRSSSSRIPLVFVWPGHIPAGKRIRERVSMVDVLPTVLELVGLPQPEVLQGQSLAPLIMGRAGWEPRPVIFEQPTGDPPGGQIEVIDGRWGASLLVGEPGNRGFPRSGPTLLLYDVEDDPMALHPVNDEYPDLVAKYTDFLTEQWEAHQLLAKSFTPGGAVELTAAQLETLRTLGYIR